MSSTAAAYARRMLPERFRWTHGHADFSQVLRDPRLLAALGPVLGEPFRKETLTGVVAIEARGLVFGGLVAAELGVGLVLARKPGGVHPGAVTEISNTLDWRGRTVELQISQHAMDADDRLLLVDDWIETGTQARTVARLVDRLGGVLVGTTVVVDDTTEAVRQDLRVSSVVRSTELPPPGSVQD